MDPAELVRRFALTPYHRHLGIEAASVAPEAVQLRLPYADGNSNPGGALHGGVAASLIASAGALAAWSGAEPAPDATGLPVDVSIDYLAAAIGESIVADGRVLRRGKELAYVDVDVRTDAGKPIAKGLVTYRIGPPPAPDRDRPTHVPVAPAAAALPPFARFFTGAPFMAGLGLVAEAAADGRAQMTLPCAATCTDAAGAVHEGAAAALADSTAAMAAWSLVPLDARNKASTVGLHLGVGGAVPGAALVATAAVVQRRSELFLASVTVAARDDGRVVAVGSVTYRIVVP